MELEESLKYWKSLEEKTIIIDVFNNTITVSFFQKDFFHAIGLHKLNNMKGYFQPSSFKKTKTIDILQKNQKAINDIKNSKQYDEVRNRCRFIHTIPWIFISGTVEFIKGKKSRFSSIEADYLFTLTTNYLNENKMEQTVVHLYIEQDTQKQICYVKSFFSNKTIKNGYNGKKAKVQNIRIKNKKY